MNDFERLAELYSRINEQMAQKSEEQNELQEAYNKLKETFKIKIGGILDIWEKDIEEGRRRVAASDSVSMTVSSPRMRSCWGTKPMSYIMSS